MTNADTMTTRAAITRAAITTAREAHRRASGGDLFHTDETRQALDRLKVNSRLSWSPAWRAEIDAAIKVLSALW